MAQVQRLPFWYFNSLDDIGLEQISKGIYVFYKNQVYIVDNINNITDTTTLREAIENKNLVLTDLEDMALSTARAAIGDFSNLDVSNLIIDDTSPKQDKAYSAAYTRKLISDTKTGLEQSAEQNKERINTLKTYCEQSNTLLQDVSTKLDNSIQTIEASVQEATQIDTNVGSNTNLVETHISDMNTLKQSLQNSQQYQILKEFTNGVITQQDNVVYTTKANEYLALQNVYIEQLGTVNKVTIKAGTRVLMDENMAFGDIKSIEHPGLVLPSNELKIEVKDIIGDGDSEVSKVIREKILAKYSDSKTLDILCITKNRIVVNSKTENTSLIYILDLDINQLNTEDIVYNTGELYIHEDILLIASADNFLLLSLETGSKVNMAGGEFLYMDRTFLVSKTDKTIHIQSAKATTSVEVQYTNEYSIKQFDGEAIAIVEGDRATIADKQLLSRQFSFSQEYNSFTYLNGYLYYYNSQLTIVNLADNQERVLGGSTFKFTSMRGKVAIADNERQPTRDIRIYTLSPTMSIDNYQHATTIDGSGNKYQDYIYDEVVVLHKPDTGASKVIYRNQEITLYGDVKVYTVDENSILITQSGGMPIYYYKGKGLKIAQTPADNILTIEDENTVIQNKNGKLRVYRPTEENKINFVGTAYGLIVTYTDDGVLTIIDSNTDEVVYQKSRIVSKSYTIIDRFVVPQHEEDNLTVVPITDKRLGLVIYDLSNKTEALKIDFSGNTHIALQSSKEASATIAAYGNKLLHAFYYKGHNTVMHSYSDLTTPLTGLTSETKVVFAYERHTNYYFEVKDKLLTYCYLRERSMTAFKNNLHIAYNITGSSYYFSKTYYPDKNYNIVSYFNSSYLVSVFTKDRVMKVSNKSKLSGHVQTVCKDKYVVGSYAIPSPSYYYMWTIAAIEGDSHYVTEIGEKWEAEKTFLLDPNINYIHSLVTKASVLSYNYNNGSYLGLNSTPHDMRNFFRTLEQIGGALIVPNLTYCFLLNNSGQLNQVTLRNSVRQDINNKGTAGGGYVLSAGQGKNLSVIRSWSSSYLGSAAYNVKGIYKGYASRYAWVEQENNYLSLYDIYSRRSIYNSNGTVYGVYNKNAFSMVNLGDKIAISDSSYSPREIKSPYSPSSQIQVVDTGGEIVYAKQGHSLIYLRDQYQKIDYFSYTLGDVAIKNDGYNALSAVKINATTLQFYFTGATIWQANVTQEHLNIQYLQVALDDDINLYLALYSTNGNRAKVYLYVGDYFSKTISYKCTINDLYIKDHFNVEKFRARKIDSKIIFTFEAGSYVFDTNHETILPVTYNTGLKEGFKPPMSYDKDSLKDIKSDKVINIKKNKDKEGVYANINGIIITPGD